MAASYRLAGVAGVGGRDLTVEQEHARTLTAAQKASRPVFIHPSRTRQPSLRPHRRPDRPRTAEIHHLAGRALGRWDVEIAECRKHFLRGLLGGRQVVRRVVVMRALRLGRMMRRGTHAAHAVRTVETQCPGCASSPRPKRQHHLPTGPATNRGRCMDQAARIESHDAVVAVGDVTALTRVTAVGNVTASRHVGRASARAAVAATPMSAAPYEATAAEMPAAGKMPAAGLPTAAPAMSAAAAPSVTSASTARGSTRRTGSPWRCAGKRRGDESGKTEEGSQRDEAGTHGPISERTMLRELHARRLNPSLPVWINTWLKFV